LLGLVGLYTILTELLRTDRRPRAATSVGRLIVMGVALSIDNLVIGFALGAYSVGLATAVLTIAIVSVGLSLLGLELGSRLGERLGPRSELIGGCVLVAVGVAIGTGLL
jgi:putative Mn2+ efflux pump MntP